MRKYLRVTIVRGCLIIENTYASAQPGFITAEANFTNSDTPLSALFSLVSTECQLLQLIHQTCLKRTSEKGDTLKVVRM